MPPKSKKQKSNLRNLAKARQQIETTRLLVGEPQPMSASKRKLSGEFEMESFQHEETESNVSNHIWSTTSIENVLMYSACPCCNSKVLNVVYKPDGVSCRSILSCRDCSFERIIDMDHKKEQKKSNDMNIKAVRGTMHSGGTFTTLKTVLSYLNLPCLANNTYIKISKEIADKSMVVTKQMFDDIAKKIRVIYMQKDESIRDGDVIDICVSYDGSWHKSGFSSKNGVGTIVEMETGLVLDYEALSLYCHSCSCNKSKMESVEFQQWYETHKTKCGINYTGSSGSMEVAAAEAIWKRSIERYGFRYTTMLSDGDCKMFSQLNSLRIYGETDILKEECINHIHKRMNTAFTKLVKRGKHLGVQFGGHGGGKLTANVIKKLGIYFSNAIRDNANNLEGMTEAVWATFYHVTSTDEIHNHSKCNIKWCFYRKAIAKGEIPKSHKDMDIFISPVIAPHLKPIYERLSSESLLSRCLRTGTHNCNELFHSTIWSKCKMTSFCGFHIIQYAVNTGIISYNAGAENAIKALNRELGLETNVELEVHGKAANVRRIANAHCVLENST